MPCATGMFESCAKPEADVPDSGARLGVAGKTVANYVSIFLVTLQVPDKERAAELARRRGSGDVAHKTQGLLGDRLPHLGRKLLSCE